MSKPAIKIMAFGTFEILHPGHEYFLKKAKQLAKNSFLIVSIARDINVKKIKGFFPINNEKKRAANLKKSGWADKVILGSLTDYLKPIIKESPQIIALGYDQRVYTENLRKKLAEKDLKVKVIRVKSHFPKKYKSSIMKQKQQKANK